MPGAWGGASRWGPAAAQGSAGKVGGWQGRREGPGAWVTLGGFSSRLGPLGYKVGPSSGRSWLHCPALCPAHAKPRPTPAQAAPSSPTGQGQTILMLRGSGSSMGALSVLPLFIRSSPLGDGPAGHRFGELSCRPLPGLALTPRLGSPPAWGLVWLSLVPWTLGH